VPWTKRPRLFAFCAVTAGPVPEGVWPPRECQAFQEAPPSVVVLVQMTSSLPRTKASITPFAGDVAAGDEVIIPPRDCHDHVVPSQ
jgi:hypothetical protein